MKIFVFALTALMLTTSAPATHIATWYDLTGRKTASGQRMHRDSLTAAYNSARFGTRIEVTNTRSGQKCTVTVNDRMGLQSPNRIDLSKTAFGSIALIGTGRIQVSLRILK